MIAKNKLNATTGLDIYVKNVWGTSTMTENVDLHHHNLDSDECRVAFDDWIEEQCKDFVNSLNARFEIKMYTNGVLMAVRQ